MAQSVLWTLFYFMAFVEHRWPVTINYFGWTSLLSKKNQRSGNWTVRWLYMPIVKQPMAVLEQRNALEKAKSSIKICWVEGHCKISGNESGDELASCRWVSIDLENEKFPLCQKTKLIFFWFLEKQVYLTLGSLKNISLKSDLLVCWSLKTNSLKIQFYWSLKIIL